MTKKITFILTFVLLSFGFLQAQNWVEVSKTLPTPNMNNQNDKFGNSVAIYGNIAVVGSPENHKKTGIATVLQYDGTNWQKVAELKAKNLYNFTYFGYSVDICNDVIVVGAYGYGEDSEGATFVFEKPATGWADMTETAKLTASDGVMDDQFGFSVSISGDNIVVGAMDKEVVYVFEKTGTNWADMTETAKLTASDITKSFSDAGFGVSVAVSGNTIIVGRANDDVNGDDSGSAYVFEKTGTTWTDMTETAKLTASDGAEDDMFGKALDIYNDTIIVGALKAGNKGAIYVFGKPSAGWTNMTETAKLTASDALNNDYLGFSVNISGNNIVAGAYGSDTGASGAGVAYIFTKTGANWTTATETAKITASDPEQNADLGISVGIENDKVIVGAFTDNNGVDSGSAYFYKKTGTNWVSATENQKILPTPYQNNIDEYYGKASSISGDYAVVGAVNYNDNQGRAYVMHYNGTDWKKVAILTLSDGESDDNFGESVGISGDVIVVGASKKDNKGVAYIFEKPATGWEDMTETAKLTGTGISILDYFGFSVSISGDVIVVGAYKGPGNNTNTGAVYLYEKPATGWEDMTETAKLKSSDGASGDKFGYSVCISDDLVIVGATEDDDTANKSGSAYIFEKPITGWTNMTETAKFNASDAESYNYFGNSVSVDGDNVVVGAYKNDATGTYSGAAYVFTKPMTGWANMTETAKLLGSNTSIVDYFGYSVTIQDDKILVGATSGGGDYAKTGAVYLFEKPSTGWTNMTETLKISAHDGSAYDNFGASVCIDADNILIGAFFNDEIDDNAGAAYFFKNNSFTITTQPVSLTNACEGASDIILSVEGSDASCTYQWYVGDTQISGATSTNYNVVATSSNSGTYSCVVSLSGNNLRSYNAVVNIHPVPTANAGDDVTNKCSLSETLTANTLSANETGAWTIASGGTGIFDNSTMNNANFTADAQGTYILNWTVTNTNCQNTDQVQISFSADDENPTLTCVGNQIINLNSGETSYTVSGTEFDLTASADNCEIASTENDFNSSESLASASLPIGTTTITWTVTDNAGNSANCSFDVQVNAYNEVNMVSENNISIYPNPTKSLLNISSESKISSIKITDISGKIMFENKNTNIANTVDISGFVNGLYFIEIETNNEIFKEKIIKN